MSAPAQLLGVPVETRVMFSVERDMHQNGIAWKDGLVHYNMWKWIPQGMPPEASADISTIRTACTVLSVVYACEFPTPKFLQTKSGIKIKYEAEFGSSWSLGRGDNFCEQSGCKRND